MQFWWNCDIGNHNFKKFRMIILMLGPIKVDTKEISVEKTSINRWSKTRKTRVCISSTVRQARIKDNNED
jgi:hypothetical protein